MQRTKLTRSRHFPRTKIHASQNESRFLENIREIATCRKRNSASHEHWPSWQTNFILWSNETTWLARLLLEILGQRIWNARRERYKYKKKEETSWEIFFCELQGIVEIRYRAKYIFWTVNGETFLLRDWCVSWSKASRNFFVIISGVSWLFVPRIPECGCQLVRRTCEEFVRIRGKGYGREMCPAWTNIYMRSSR